MVIKAELKDISTVAELAVQMWEDNTVEDLIQEFTELLSKGRTQFFLIYENDIPVGFAQCQLRSDYVEGTETSPVGYLEGIFVREEYWQKGYVRPGPESRARGSLPATVSWTIWEAIGFTWRWALRKQTGLSVLPKSFLSKT